MEKVMKHAIKSLLLGTTLIVCATSSTMMAPVQAATLDASLVSTATPIATTAALRGDVGTGVDGLLGLVLGSALVVLQLRRRQKSMRMSRLRIG
jgi:hypothetical protein